jgi:uncharacterized membrane protein (UPF0182 family)
LAVWVAVTVVASSIYPALVQRFQVSPNELTLERPFIEDNIEFTRLAYDLEKIDLRSYDASQQLTPAALLAEPATVRNVRLWDYRPLLETYNQVQALRQYYAFNDVDVDRYTVDGRAAQVMVAARELVPDRLSRAGADLGQPQAGLHARLRRGDVAGRTSDGGRPARILHQGPAAGRQRALTSAAALLWRV